MVLQILNRSGESPSWTCWLHFYQGSPGCCWPSLQGHIGGACSLHCPSWSPGHFCSELLPSHSHPSLCGITPPRCKVRPLWGSCQTITAAWAAPSESQSCPPVHWLLALRISAPCKFVESFSSCSPKSQLQQPHTLSEVLPSQRAEGICLNMTDTARGKVRNSSLLALQSRTRLLRESSSKQSKPSPTAASIINFL